MTNTTTDKKPARGDVTVEKPISKNLAAKMRQVKELSAKIKNSKTVAVVDLKGMPNKILYKIRKAFMGQASMVVAKKAVLLNALQESDSIPRIAELIPDVESAQSALLISKSQDPMSLYAKIVGMKESVPAGVGKVSESDIMVLAGETGLPPGPAIGPLQKAGLPARIHRGKILIDKDHLLVPAGTQVSLEAAEALLTLGIVPFEVQLNITKAWEDGIIFERSVLALTPELVMQNTIQAAAHARALALFVNYPCSETIELLIGKAAMAARGLALAAGVVNKDTIADLLARAELGAKAISAKVGVAVGDTEERNKEEAEAEQEKESKT